MGEAMSTSSGSDDLDHEAGYRCVAAGERLGVYDGHERWSVFAGGLTDPDLQVTVLLHERLHHELQHTTPWGVVCGLAFELARMDVQRDRFLRLARFGREAARRCGVPSTISARTNPASAPEGSSATRSGQPPANSHGLQRPGPANGIDVDADHSEQAVCLALDVPPVELIQPCRTNPDLHAVSGNRGARPIAVN